MSDEREGDYSDSGKLSEILELARENNRMLRGMHRRMVIGQIMTVLYWLIIIGAAGWAYYYFKPVLETYLQAYQGVTHMLEGLEEKGRTLPSDLQGLLERVR
jgi:hypothetical protein